MLFSSISTSKHQVNFNWATTDLIQRHNTSPFLMEISQPVPLFPIYGACKGTNLTVPYLVYNLSIINTMKHQNNRSVLYNYFINCFSVHWHLINTKFCCLLYRLLVRRFFVITALYFIGNHQVSKPKCKYSWDNASEIPISSIHTGWHSWSSENKCATPYDGELCLHMYQHGQGHYSGEGASAKGK